jgi:antitoxin (DNA-binding transcriptional repressor) of toxin-antitoxin stability system
MTKIIGLKELRLNTESYIAQVKKGVSFIVVKRSEPVFKISPYQFEEIDLKDDGPGWKKMIDFRKLTGNKNGIDAQKLIDILEKINKDEQNRKVSR